MTVSAFAVAGAVPLGGGVATVALGLIIIIGALQIYLAVRIEFDRQIFDLAAGDPEGFAGFDQSGRSSEARAAGLASLVRWSGVLLAAQLILALVVLTVP
jgi:hypothetical protein